MHKVTDRKLNERVKLGFKLTQHIRDEQLMKSLIELLGCGNLVRKGDAVDFTITKLSNLTDKIIPILKKYPIVGVKGLDFADWCEVAEMMKKKEHLTSEGLEKIKKIKAEMNIGRKFS